MSDQEKIFANGLITKKPHEKAPDFVKYEQSFKVEDFIEFLKQHNKNGWVNTTIKVSKSGSIYSELNVWEKKTEAVKVEEPKIEEMPF